LRDLAAGGGLLFGKGVGEGQKLYLHILNESWPESWMWPVCARSGEEQCLLMMVGRVGSKGVSTG